MFNENKLNIFVKIEADIRNQAKAKVKQAWLQGQLAKITRTHHQ